MNLADRIDRMFAYERNQGGNFPGLENGFEKRRFLGFLKTKNPKVKNLGFGGFLLKSLVNFFLQIIFSFTF